MSTHTAERCSQLPSIYRPLFLSRCFWPTSHPPPAPVQHPDIGAIATALRVSLSHAYYGTPPNMVPFAMALPKSLHKPLPPLDPAAHQVNIVFS